MAGAVGLWAEGTIFAMGNLYLEDNRVAGVAVGYGRA
jgi:hypothetical protein